jgi:putative redox protein
MVQTLGTSAKPARIVECELKWVGDLRFAGRSGDAAIVLDSAGMCGPSPMQALAFALAGCMGIDVVHFLERSRVPATAVNVSTKGRRAPGDPGRFVAIDMHFTIEGAASDEQVERAIRLSSEKYCSVWHSLNPDVTFQTSFDVKRG